MPEMLERELAPARLSAAPTDGRRPIRVLFAGGGTGGHLYPGMEVAYNLRARTGARCVFAGTGKPVEARVLEGSGFELARLPAARAPRGLRDVPGAALATLVALRASLAWLRALDPDFVVGLGGYASAAPAAAAAIRRRPLFLLEQNAVPGRANRWLAHLASEVYVAWPEARSHLPGRTPVKVLGNPVRSSVLRNVADARARLGLAVSGATLLVVGGSQGARGLNRAIEARIGRLAAERDRLQIVHLAGEEDAPRMRVLYQAAGIRAFVAAYFSAMEIPYSAADLVLARAGGTTIAELFCRGLPAVLVPYPYAAEDHQTYNARAAERAGGAVLIPEADLADNGIERVLALAFDATQRKAISERMRRGARPEAAFAIATRMLNVAVR